MKFIKKNTFNIIFIALFFAVIFVPNAKAFLLKGLINIGFFSPSIETYKVPVGDLSGIRFSNIKGETIDLGNLKEKVIFLNFWATWCPPCRAEMPSINKLYTLFKNEKNVVFIFADADGNLVKSTDFMKKHKYEMPVYKIDSEIPKQIFKGSLPTTIIFDKQGRISLNHEGMADYSNQKIIDFLKKLQNE